MVKNKISPTNNEKLLNESDFIVSKTDTQGKIIYCNKIFMELAEYDENELINVNHNIVRHPDMPRVAFKLAWDLLKSGKEFFGFVKNLRKNGGFYWVYTNITPDFNENGKIIGYTSVRRKPSKAAISTIIPIYQQLISLEKGGDISNSEKFLINYLKENNITYEELIISLQGKN